MRGTKHQTLETCDKAFSLWGCGDKQEQKSLVSIVDRGENPTSKRKSLCDGAGRCSQGNFQSLNYGSISATLEVPPAQPVRVSWAVPKLCEQRFPATM